MRTSNYQLAQINIAKANGLMSDPVMQGFVDQLDLINQMAENAPGFIWRLIGEDGADATSIQAFDDPSLLVNMRWSYFVGQFGSQVKVYFCC